MKQQTIAELEVAFYRLTNNKQKIFDFKQLARGLNWIQQQTNPFICNVINEHSQNINHSQENKQGFQELIKVLNDGFANKQDNQIKNAMFEIIDSDCDGFIGVEDIVKSAQQIGVIIPQKYLKLLLQTITEQGTKMSKFQFDQFFGQFL